MKITPMARDRLQDVCEEAIRMATADKCEVSFEFNGHTLTATASSTLAGMLKAYDEAWKAASAAYLASDEYKQAEARRAEEKRQKAEELAYALTLAPAQMTLRDPDAWQQFCENNTDPRGAGVLRYAQTWARVMEGMHANGARIPDIAERCSRIADSEGITGFMHGCAKAALRLVWIHGGQL
jgi:hypothetical protein